MLKLTLAALLLASPVMAEFTPRPLVSFCTDKLTDIENVFGEINTITPSAINEHNRSMVVMDNDTHKIYAIGQTPSTFCVVFVVEKDPSA